MSNVGQIAVDIIGVAIAVALAPATGGASLALQYALTGFAIASAVGQVLFPTQLPNATGPRLGDHATTSASLGDPIVVGYGTFPTAGTVIFLDAVVEHSTTARVGGKHGQKQTTYTYTQSIGIGLCETTSMGGTNNPILGIQRIWENGELVYDTRGIQPGETTDPRHGGHDGGRNESSGTYQKRLRANDAYAATFVLYLGTEDQAPDPTIELQQGVGTTLSYRGLAYIVYPDRLLRDDQGQRHPTFKFEIVASGTTEASITDPTFTPGGYHDLIQINMIATDFSGLRYYITNATSITKAAILGFSLPDNVQFAELSEDDSPGMGVHSSLDIAMSPDGVLIGMWIPSGTAARIYRLDPDTLAILTSAPYDAFGIDWQCTATITVNFGSGPRYFICGVGVLGRVTVTDCVSLISAAPFTYTDHPKVCAGLPESGNGVFWIISNTPSIFGPTGGDIAVHKILVTAGSTTSTLMATIAPSDIDATWTYIQSIGDMILDPDDGHIIMRAKTGGVGLGSGNIFKFNGETGVIDWTLSVALGANYDIGINQSHIANHILWLADSLGPQHYSAIDTRTGVRTDNDLSGISGMTFIQGATVTNASLLGGMILASLTGKPTGWSVILPNEPIAGDVTIADIVADLCERSGLHDHDTSSLGAQAIDGYVIAGSPMNARDAIVPLRSVGFFDSVESGDTMKFVKRGGSPALTLGVDDIGAVESDTSEDPPPANSVTVAMESDLPQQIRVTYMSPSRDYQPGTQLSPARFDTTSQNIADVQLGGVCLDDDFAAQVSEILWNDAWEADHSFSFAVDMSFAALEPTDVVLVPMQGTLYRVRIVTIDDSSQVLRQITAATDDDGNYVSAAVSQDVPVSLTMKFNADTSLLLMDSPLMADADDTGRVSAPMYSAVFPLGLDSWIGAGIYDSPDGVTYTGVALAPNKADSGTATTILDDTADPFVTDIVNTVTIQMSDASTLPATITDDQLLAGGNFAALIDADGVVELFQFRDVVAVDASTVTLSHLLRGRRGSEAMTGNHDIGSRFVMLATGAVQKENLNLSDLTREFQWKAVGSEDTLDDVAAVPFTSVGRSLMPRAPWNTRTTLAGSDILIMADRRSRVENDSPIGFASPTLPLNEDSELYEVDIFDAPGTSVLRTISATSLPITYSAADIVSDFGSTPADITLAVYQMSGQVGRGFTHKVNVGVPT